MVMNLTGMRDVQFGDPEAFKVFLDVNFMAHETVNGALLELGLVISHYPLQEDGSTIADWKLTHAAEHRAIAIALGLPGAPPLDEVDFEKEQQFDDWLGQHAQHHDLIAATLGI
jgi:hypothetical protein